MITLFDYWRSSASYRVRIALGLTGEAWQSQSVNLLSAEHKSRAHLDRNPQGLVPALEIDGVMMTQSLAIIEYLDETRALGLLPANALDRARARRISHAIAMDIHPVCNLGVAKYAVALSGEQIAMQDWMTRFITPGLIAVEEMVDDGDFCIGQNVTLADICLLPQLYNADRWNVDLTAMPKLRRIGAALGRMPAFAAAHPDQTPH